MNQYASYCPVWRFLINLSPHDDPLPLSTPPPVVQAQEVQTQANRVGDLFLKIDKALQDEDDRDARFRAQWGEAWEKVGVPSATLQADTRKELAHFQASGHGGEHSHPTANEGGGG
jgi:hypothetical protein